MVNGPEPGHHLGDLVPAPPRERDARSCRRRTRPGLRAGFATSRFAYGSASRAARRGSAPVKGICCNQRRSTPVESFTRGRPGGSPRRSRSRRDRGRRAREALRRFPGRPRALLPGRSRARCWAWSGPNGAGKTTTIRSIAGIIIPSRGRIRIGGHDLATRRRSPPSRCSRSSRTSRTCSTTSPSRSTSGSSGRLYQVADVDARIPGLLEELELASKRDALPGELSRGMKQKLAIACGLLHAPRALLLDEPLTGLDPVGIRRMKATIVRRAEAGAAVILSSHLLHLVEEICTRVLVMNARTAGGVRHDRRDRRQPPGVERPAAGGRVPGAHHARRRATRVIRVFTYLAWRSAYNRVRAPDPPAPEPALSGGTGARARLPLDRGGRAAAPAGHPQVLVGRAVARAHRRARRGRRAALGLGVRRRAPRARLQSRRGDVPLLGTGDTTRPRAVQAAAKPAPHPLQLAPLDADPRARALRGLAVAPRASIWVLLTTISFHRLGASFVRTSLLEHGRIALRHRLVSLALLGAAAGRAGVERPGCAAGPRRRLGGRTRPPFSTPWPTRPPTGPPGAARAVSRDGAAAGRALPRRLATRGRPRARAAGASLRLGHPGGHRVRGGRGRSVPAARAAHGFAARRGVAARLAHRKPPAAACAWRPSAGRRGAILWKNLLAVVRTRRARNMAMALARRRRSGAARSRSRPDGTVAEIAGWLARRPGPRSRS